MFKKLLILAILAGGAWYGYMNYYIAQQENPQLVKNFMPNIIKVDANQVEYLINSGNKLHRPTLLYIFESDCMMCKWYFPEIMHFADQYTRSQVNIILLSLDSDEMILAEFLAPRKPTIRPLILKQGQRETLFSVLRKMGSTYDGSVPHIAVINKVGHFDDIGMSWDPKNKINGFILRSLDAKQ